MSLGLSTIQVYRSLGNEPFGSRPEPGVYRITPILLLPSGEVPEGRAKSTRSLWVDALKRIL